MMHEPLKRQGKAGVVKCFLGDHDYCLCEICLSDDMGRSICLREEPTTSWFRGTKNYHSKLYVRPQHLEEKLDER